VRHGLPGTDRSHRARWQRGGDGGSRVKDGDARRLAERTAPMSLQEQRQIGYADDYGCELWMVPAFILAHSALTLLRDGLPEQAIAAFEGAVRVLRART